VLVSPEELFPTICHLPSLSSYEADRHTRANSEPDGDTARRCQDWVRARALAGTLWDRQGYAI